MGGGGEQPILIRLSLGCLGAEPNQARAIAGDHIVHMYQALSAGIRTIQSSLGAIHTGRFMWERWRDKVCNDKAAAPELNDPGSCR